MKQWFGIGLLLLSFASVGMADVLELNDGKLLNGKYVGGTGESVRFETAEGVQVHEISEIVELTFTGKGQSKDQLNEPSGAASKKPTASAGAVPSAESATRKVTLPAGTTLLVKLAQGVSSSTPSGETFSTRLEYDLTTSDGVTVLKAGTPIYGEVTSTQAKRLRGKSTLDLRLTKIVADGTEIPISTASFQEASDASVKKAARGAAGGAVVGAIAGEAGTGAAIGTAVGALRRPESINVQSGALLEFALTEAVTIKPAK